MLKDFQKFLRNMALRILQYNKNRNGNIVIDFS